MLNIFKTQNTEVIIIKNYNPHRNALNLLRLGIAILALALTIVTLIFLNILPILMYILVGIVCATAFVLDFILLPIYFYKTSYTVGENYISKKGGIFFTTKQYMKKSSVQYITVLKTPLSKFTAGNFIVIHALGGGIILHFLSDNDTEEIKNLMKKWTKEKEGDGKI